MSTFTSRYTGPIYPRVSNPVSSVSTFTSRYTGLIHPRVSNPVSSVSTFTGHYTCLIHPLYTSNFMSVSRATLTIATPAWFSHLYGGMGNMLWILWLFDRHFCTSDHISLSCRCFSALHDHNSRVHQCLADSYVQTFRQKICSHPTEQLPVIDPLKTKDYYFIWKIKVMAKHASNHNIQISHGTFLRQQQKHCCLQENRTQIHCSTSVSYKYNRCRVFNGKLELN